MIIDMVLDRKDYYEQGHDVYNAGRFYNYCMMESSVFNGIGDKITSAMDYGENDDVQRAICDYINEQGYNPKICEFVREVNWLEDARY